MLLVVLPAGSAASAIAMISAERMKCYRSTEAGIVL